MDFPLRTQIPLDKLVAHLEQRIPELMEKATVSGLSIALITDAKLIWNRGFGYSNVTSKEPVTPDTLFEAASLSKPVFAYLALKLCQDGPFKAFAVGFKDQGIGAVVMANSVNSPRIWRDVLYESIGGEYPAIAWLEDIA